MPEGIIILGSAGSGKTPLGHLVASGLGFAHLDIDSIVGTHTGPGAVGLPTSINKETDK